MYNEDETGNENENEFNIDDDMDLGTMDPLEKEEVEDDPEDKFH